MDEKRLTESPMLPRLRFAIYVCGMLIFLSLACVEKTFPARAQGTEAIVVKMTAEHAFVPKAITIRVGQTVEWVNAEEGGIHEVTTDSDVATDPADVSIPDGVEPFDSHLIKSGKSFQHKFTAPGVYNYTCPPHEHDGMVGKVTVTK
jgi:plastocyanin